MNLNISQIKMCALVLLAVAGNLSVLAQPAGGPAKLKDFDAFKIITDRNIFDPNRRPPRVNREAPAPAVDSFSLTGTMSYEKGFFAVFDGTSSDYHKVLEPGGKIAAYTLTEVGHDSVKLSHGTNEIIELRVGMQMRRSPDGKWSAADQAEGVGYASNSRRNWDRGGGDRSERRGGRNNFRGNNNQSNGGTASSEAAAPTPPPEMTNLDPNDPVARLMLRRMQETGGAPSNEGGGPTDISNPANGPGDNPAGNVNVNQPGNNGDNQERTDNPPNPPGNTNPTDNTPNRR
jgi:hypothetical protein